MSECQPPFHPGFFNFQVHHFTLRWSGHSLDDVTSLWVTLWSPGHSPSRPAVSILKSLPLGGSNRFNLPSGTHYTRCNYLLVNWTYRSSRPTAFGAWKDFALIESPARLNGSEVSGSNNLTFIQCRSSVFLLARRVLLPCLWMWFDFYAPRPSAEDNFFLLIFNAGVRNSHSAQWTFESFCESVFHSELPRTEKEIYLFVCFLSCWVEKYKFRTRAQSTSVLEISILD